MNGYNNDVQTRASVPARRRNNRRRKREKKRFVIILLVLYVVVFIIGVFVGRRTKNIKMETSAKEVVVKSDEKLPDYVDVDIIPVNGVGRRGEKLEAVNDIVIHYTGNPGTTAEQNHTYYSKPDTEVSSHFLIGMDGKVIQCVPLDEKSSATSERNRDTISIEVCHPDESGKFTEEAYESLVSLVAWLCNHYGLDISHVIRHYDATGKICPKYYVENEDAWEKLLKDIDAKIEKKEKKLFGIF